MGERIGWTIRGAAQGTSSATKAAESGRQHVIYGVSASFDATDSAVLKLYDGVVDDANLIFEHYIYDSESLSFPAGIAATKGNAVAAEITQPATGIGTVVNLHGATF